MPTFLVIGAAKSGTNSLYHYLQQHPQVYMCPRREPNFFALEGSAPNFHGPGDATSINLHSITDVHRYRQLFSGVRGERAIGEVSPLYLYHPRAPTRIRHHIPEACLVCILRDPAERAYSHYLQFVRDGIEPCPDFATAIEEERAGRREGWAWSYLSMGFYHRQLQRYGRWLAAGRLAVFLFEDFARDAAGVMQDLFRFLQLDPLSTLDTSARHNPSGIPESRRLHALLRKPNAVRASARRLVPLPVRRRAARLLQRRLHANMARPPLPPPLRQGLVDLYRPDLLRLQDLIGRDLSVWLR